VAWFRLCQCTLYGSLPEALWVAQVALGPLSVLFSCSVFCRYASVCMLALFPCPCAFRQSSSCSTGFHFNPSAVLSSLSATPTLHRGDSRFLFLRGSAQFNFCPNPSIFCEEVYPECVLSPWMDNRFLPRPGRCRTGSPPNAFSFFPYLNLRFATVKPPCGAADTTPGNACLH